VLGGGAWDCSGQRNRTRNGVARRGRDERGDEETEEKKAEKGDEDRDDRQAVRGDEKEE
jgi:hypothetical protein